MIAWLHVAGDAFECGILGQAADKLAGIARKPGRKLIAADAELLVEIESRRSIHGASTVSIVVKRKFPGDELAQVNAAQRLRRKMRTKKRT